ncbi:hypothetical protein ACNHYB_10610 [Isoptericola jiangsuensis]|uniref:hypothetical protein n=1 Tax=Isoptericola jiangsuensis TaxID=548579 RepID=UPI003AAF9038
MRDYQDRVEVGRATASGTDTWLVPVRIPAMADLPREDGLPILHGVDLVRRLGEVLAFDCFDVPPAHHLSIRRIAFRWSGRPLRLPPAGTIGASAFVHVHAHRERHGHTSAFEASAVLRVGSHEIAHASGAARCIDPTTYSALRRGVARVERRFDVDPLSDVRRRADRLLATVGWDSADPLLDARAGELPGLALINASVRAAHLLRPTRTVAGVSLTVERFVDGSPRPTVYATAATDEVEVSVLQNRTVAARCVVRLAPVR